MRNWALRASQYLLIATLIVSFGGHLALLQTIAWGNMMVNYSQAASVKEAAKMTFDGQHPCPMCKLVKESKKEEDKKPLVKAASNVEVILPAEIALKPLWGLPVVNPVPSHDARLVEVFLAVPLQPPRAA